MASHFLRQFANRKDAGQQLSAVLQVKLTDEERKSFAKNGVVLALPRGALEIGAIVAKALGAEFDILSSRKIGLPGQEEYGIGAITARGHRVLDMFVISQLKVSSEYIEAKSREQMQIAQEREKQLRGSRPFVPLQGKDVLIVDDGIATGHTMKAAVADVLAQQANSVIVAVPVAAADSVIDIERCRGVKRVVTVLAPRAMRAVGLWYLNFSQVEDQEAHAILQSVKAKEKDTVTTASPSQPQSASASPASTTPAAAITPATASAPAQSIDSTAGRT